MSELPHVDHDGLDACALALDKVHAFLHGELDEQEADQIRVHLDACERCLNDYDVEQVITTLLRRCNPPAAASTSLRMRIVSMSMTMREVPPGA